MDTLEPAVPHRVSIHNKKKQNLENPWNGFHEIWEWEKFTKICQHVTIHMTTYTRFLPFLVPNF
jgi:hypothetical protein